MSAPEHAQIAGRLFAKTEGMGTPQGKRAGYSDELPWFTFTGGGSLNDAMIALTSMEWSEERDGTRQPILPARAIWLPWKEATEAGADYHSMWSAASSLRWPNVDGGPAGADGFLTPIAVRRPAPHRAAAEIIRNDFDFTARIAAHVIEGSRVAIVLQRSDSVTTLERVCFLDAVLALLPFGARNCVTAATWASYRTAQHAVLAFSDGVQPGQLLASWHDGHVPEPQSVRGQDYLSELRTIVGEGHTITKVVDHLATKTQPLRHIDEVSVDSLRDIRFASAVYDEIMGGGGNVADVRRALREPGVKEDQTRAFVQFLANSACSADRTEADSARKAIVAEWDPMFAAVLGEQCRNGRLIADQEIRLLRLSREAGKKHEGAALAFIEHALAPPVVRSSSVLVNLTAHFLLVTKPVGPKAHRVLVEQPHVLIQALSALLGPDGKTGARSKARTLAARFKPNLNAWLNMLRREGETPMWLRPVLFAPHARVGSIRPAEVEALAELGCQALSCFLDLLDTRLGAHDVIELCWPAVVCLLSGAKAEDARELGRRVLSVPSRKRDEPSASQHARADVLSLLCRVQPRQELLETMSPDYLAELRLTLSTLSCDLRAEVTRNLVDHLHSRFGEVRPEVVRRLDAELGIGITDQYLDTLARRLDEGEVQKVHALDLPAEWRRDLGTRPGLEWYLSLLELQRIAADNGDVFEHVAGALHEPSAATEVVRILCGYTERITPVVTENLLWRIRHQGRHGEHVASKVRDHLLADAGTAAEAFVRHMNEQLARYTWLSRGETDSEENR
ncbi:hypothetical protein [Lentzea sp. NPDC003310]|uniref:hypothetical protein n=1 Tax=Lentzea sp. NPDC003310 TaxID=3154447 RepID=UPI0033BF1F86